MCIGRIPERRTIQRPEIMRRQTCLRALFTVEEYIVIFGECKIGLCKWAIRKTNRSLMLSFIQKSEVYQTIPENHRFLRPWFALHPGCATQLLVF